MDLSAALGLLFDGERSGASVVCRSSLARQGTPSRSATGNESQTPTPLTCASRESTASLILAAGPFNWNECSRLAHRNSKPFASAQSVRRTYPPRAVGAGALARVGQCAAEALAA